MNPREGGGNGGNSDPLQLVSEDTAYHENESRPEGGKRILRKWEVGIGRWHWRIEGVDTPI